MKTMYSKLLFFIHFILYINQIYSIPIMNDSLTKKEEMNQQVRSFYETIIDEVISYHSEALLYSLSYDDDIKNSLMKINQVQYEKCINNIPQYTGMLLYDKHFETYKNIGSLIEKEIQWSSNQKKMMNEEEIQKYVLYHFQQYMNPTEFIFKITTQMKICQSEMNSSSFKMKFINNNEIDYSYNNNNQDDNSILLIPLEQEINQFMDDMYNDLKDEMVYRTNDSLQLIINDIYSS